MKKTVLLLLFTFFAAFASRAFATTATRSGQTVQDQVKERMEEAKNSPKAYVGAVTDKNQNSLQVKTPKGEIKLVSVEETSTAFTKVGSKTTSAKFDDVAIGDFIIAMGVRNGNDILNATKVLITPALTKPKRTITVGQITLIVKKEVTVESDSIKLTLKFPKKWQGPDIKELAEGDKVVVVGEIEGTVLTLRSIFKI